MGLSLCVSSWTNIMTHSSASLLALLLCARAPTSAAHLASMSGRYGFPSGKCSALLPTTTRAHAARQGALQEQAGPENPVRSFFEQVILTETHPSFDLYNSIVNFTTSGTALVVPIDLIRPDDSTMHHQGQSNGSDPFALHFGAMAPVTAGTYFESENPLPHSAALDSALLF